MMLSFIDNEWEEIGLGLQVRTNVLKGLDQKRCTNAVKLADVINTWMDSQSSPVTWETAISVIQRRLVNVTKANEIRRHLGLPDVNN